MPDATMIYIGRSEAYAEIFHPRVLHLEALAAKPEAKAEAKAPNATAPAL
jgi:putative ATP-binding cassette transporter